MVPENAPFTPWLLGAVLVALLSMLAWRGATQDRREYERFKRYRSTEQRQAVLLKWVLQSFVWFGGSALVVLALVWSSVPKMLVQVEAWPLMAGFHSLLEDSSLGRGLLIGGAVGLLVALIGTVFFDRATDKVPVIGDIYALLPRNRAELKYGWALSINAGIVEELLFRLALPAIIFAIVGNAAIAVIASLVVFGLMHAYQGVGGVLGVFVLGVLLMTLFLVTGTIIWSIIAHVVIDLRSLVLIPIVAFQVHRKKSPQNSVEPADSHRSASVTNGEHESSDIDP